METLSSIKSQSWLVWFIRGFLTLGFLTLVSRMFDLQVIRGSYYRSLAEDNRIRTINILAPRGEIVDRNGEVIVGNKEIKKRIIFDKGSSYEKKNDTAGANSDELITETLRDYKYNEVFGHITGYVGEVNAEELGKIKGKCPEKGPRKLGNYLGRTGLEEEYECELSGSDGEALIEVDARGHQVRVLGKKEPIPGSTIKTTLDLGLQRKISELMQGKKGAVIISNGRGGILSFYSSPGYDPNIFVEDSKKDSLPQIFKDPALPLFNRAMGGLFHPGSIFKPIVAAAALEEGKIDRNFTFNDTGQIVIKTIYGTYSFKNWYFTQYGGTEGNINLKKAIARSTDTFFYKVGELTGPDDIYKWAIRFGVGDKTGIDLPGEIGGLVPNPEWKLRVKGERWFLGNTYHLSIGQGDLALTPLGMNAAISAIANGGDLCTPHILEKKESCKKIGIKEDTIDLIKDGMNASCSPGGTAYTFFDFKEKSGIDAGCKTGTAENETGEPHAWFTAFAPLKNPEIVITILVENGGEGSKVAGPIARDLFNYWFKVQNTVTVTPTAHDEP